MTGMCPHCGREVKITRSLTTSHMADGHWCPGSRQIPRCAEADARPLWNGQPNRRFKG